MWQTENRAQQEQQESQTGADDVINGPGEHTQKAAIESFSHELFICYTRARS